jgi:hypothetical protein
MQEKRVTFNGKLFLDITVRRNEWHMALTQMQIIQSLGESMSWFERELNWGVPPTELTHLSGRIGELYAALITNGQMANSVNQNGYDVVSDSGERVSVKTTARMSTNGSVSFNPNTLNLVDRVIILRINTEEMQIETLLDEHLDTAIGFMNRTDSSGKRKIAFSKLLRKDKPIIELKKVRHVNFQQFSINELENGTIEVVENGNSITPVKPTLRNLANDLNISILNTNGNPFNTRQLGSLVITAILNIQKLK